MKQIYLITICLLFVSSASSQIWGPPVPQGPYLEAVGDCESVRVTMVPYYPEVYGQYAGFTNCESGETHCCLVLAYGSPWQPILELQKLNSSGGWDYHGSFQVYNHVFDNLAKGTYRIKATMPQIDSSCVTQLEHPPYTQYGPYYVYNTLGQFIGFKGTTLGNVVPYQPPIIHYTDAILVGPTTSSDIDWNFIKNGVPNNNFAYDEGDLVEVDASNSQNYNMWYLAIFERGGQNRYKSQGWTHGQITGFIDLTEMWWPWEFEAFTTYDVQIAIENRQCRNGIEWPGTSWTVSEQSFFVCPQGAGCRFGFDRELKQLSFYPNPASDFITLEDYDASIQGGLDLRVYDTVGRLSMSSQISDNTIDISQLEQGFYILKIHQKNKEVFSGRLIVQ